MFIKNEARITSRVYCVKSAGGNFSQCFYCFLLLFFYCYWVLQLHVLDESGIQTIRQTLPYFYME